MIFNEEHFIRWANHGNPGTKIIYADFRPCLRPSMARVVTRLTELGKITTTSKKTFVGIEEKWVATAIKL